MKPHSFLSDYLHALPAVFAVVGGSFLGVYGLELYGRELSAIQKLLLSMSFFTLSWLVVNATVQKAVGRGPSR